MNSLFIADEDPDNLSALIPVLNGSAIDSAFTHADNVDRVLFIDRSRLYIIGLLVIDSLN